MAERSPTLELVDNNKKKKELLLLNEGPEIAVLREKFAQEWLTNGFDHCKAAEAVGYTSRHGAGLMKMPEVQSAIERARKVFRNKTSSTVEELATDLDEAFDLAKKSKNPGAMVSATATKIKLLGLEAPKKLKVDTNVTGEVKHTVDRISIEERIEQLTGDIQKAIEAAPKLEEDDDGKIIDAEEVKTTTADELPEEIRAIM